MSRKLSDWAMIAEIVSGIAVVITLVFLILGIRENTAVTRAAMFDSIMHGIAEFRGHLIGNPEVAKLWEAFRDLEYDQLDRTSQTRVGQLVMLAFENYQRAYYARQYGVLGESEWTRFELQMCLQYGRVATSEEHSALLSLVLSNEFWNFMTTTCEPQDGNH